MGSAVDCDLEVILDKGVTNVNDDSFHEFAEDYRCSSCHCTGPAAVSLYWQFVDARNSMPTISAVYRRKNISAGTVTLSDCKKVIGHYVQEDRQTYFFKYWKDGMLVKIVSNSEIVPVYIKSTTHNHVSVFCQIFLTK